MKRGRPTPTLYEVHRSVTTSLLVVRPKRMDHPFGQVGPPSPGVVHRLGAFRK